MTFDKEMFAELLDKAKGDRSINNYAKECGISPAHISRLLRAMIETPPSPETIEKLTRYAYNSVSYIDLMKAAGHIPLDNNEDLSNTQPNKTFKLTRRDEREIEKIIEQTKNELENAEGLMFSGQPATPEAIQSIIDSMRIGMEIAKQRNKEKYTPNKYKKDKKNR